MRVSPKREPLFPDSSNLKVKFRKVYNYLFQGFPFDADMRDYDEYWDRLSKETRPVSSFKLELIEGDIDVTKL